jgi:hypothetical protein
MKAYLRSITLVPTWVILLTIASFVGGSGIWTSLFITRGCI